MFITTSIQYSMTKCKNNYDFNVIRSRNTILFAANFRRIVKRKAERLKQCRGVRVGLHTFQTGYHTTHHITSHHITSLHITSHHCTLQHSSQHILFSIPDGGRTDAITCNHPSHHIHLDTWRLCKTKTVEIHPYHARQFFFYLHLYSLHASIILHPFTASLRHADRDTHICTYM